MTTQNTIIADLLADIEKLKADLESECGKSGRLLSALRLVAIEVAGNVKPTSADSYLPSDVVREVVAAIAAVERPCNPAA